ncbi:MAG: M60 family metallopeptidase [Clostridiales Family XIII bacterium]|jgi:hypothetical protein|nr:M60 family metallopeptidase [Clostridiales Family XIII bacterium]
MFAGNPFEMLRSGRDVLDILPVIKFGVIHEIGHDFDLPEWNFNHELMANLKVIYAAERAGIIAEGYNEDGGSFEAAAEALYKPTYDANFGTYTEGHCTFQRDALLYLLLRIKDEVGWEPFKQTFRWYVETREGPETNAEKFELFIAKLSEYSGRDIRAEFFPDLIWRACVETDQVDGRTVEDLVPEPEDEPKEDPVPEPMPLEPEPVPMPNEPEAEVPGAEDPGAVEAPEAEAADDAEATEVADSGEAAEATDSGEAAEAPEAEAADDAEAAEATDSGEAAGAPEAEAPKAKTQKVYIMDAGVAAALQDASAQPAAKPAAVDPSACTLYQAPAPAASSTPAAPAPAAPASSSAASSTAAKTQCGGYSVTTLDESSGQPVTKLSLADKATQGTEVQATAVRAMAFELQETAPARQDVIEEEGEGASALPSLPGVLLIAAGAAGAAIALALLRRRRAGGTGFWS